MSIDTTFLIDLPKQFLSEPHSSLMTGILFGGQAKLPHDLVLALKTTNTFHIVAVSGQNMSILAGFLGKSSLLLGRKISLIFQGLGIIGYIFLVGGGASVVRSGLMALVALVAVATGRQGDSLRALTVVAVGMAIIHPAFLTDIGWQLSVAATAGIIIFEPLLSSCLTTIPKAASSVISVSLAAQIFTWPILAYYFASFSLIGVVANVAVEWAVPWIMGLGGLMEVAGLVWPFAGQLLAWLAWVPLTYLVSIVMFLSHVPGASLTVPDLSPGAVIIYYSLLLGGIYWWGYRRKLSF